MNFIISIDHFILRWNSKLHQYWILNWIILRKFVNFFKKKKFIPKFRRSQFVNWTWWRVKVFYCIECFNSFSHEVFKWLSYFSLSNKCLLNMFEEMFTIFKWIWVFFLNLPIIYWHLMIRSKKKNSFFLKTNIYLNFWCKKMHRHLCE